MISEPLLDPLGQSPPRTSDFIGRYRPQLKADNRNARRQQTLQMIEDARAASSMAMPQVQPPQVNILGTQQGQTGLGPAQGIAKQAGRNGRLDPQSELAPIGNGHYLQPAAAAAWNRMVADAKAQGVNITITDSYRPYDVQVRLAKQKGLYSQGGLAAKPGTSNHGWGLAVDVKTGREWLAKNAHRYGFKTIPREPWHWEYKP